MFETGYWKIGTFRGVPIRLHWSIPVGALIFSGFTFAPAFWLAFFLLIFLHELGHAAIVRRFGHRTLSIDITGFGGLCRWSGHATAFERSAIAWGGVLAQFAVLIGTLTVVTFISAPTHPYAAQVADVFIRTNLFLIALNLIPFPPLDGAEAWKVFRQGRFRALLSSLRGSLSSKSRPVKAKQPPGKVIDFEDWARRQGKRPSTADDDVAHDIGVEKRAAKDVAAELIRISQEAAKARKKRDEN